MRKQFIYVTSPICAAIIVAGAWLANAGQLNPPLGPVASTGRFGPRTEINVANTPGDVVSLFVITQPGSYYLGGNITGVGGLAGIGINADNVTLVLNGFALIGVAGSVDGIRALSSVENVVIRNGNILVTCPHFMYHLL